MALGMEEGDAKQIVAIDEEAEGVALGVLVERERKSNMRGNSVSFVEREDGRERDSDLQLRLKLPYCQYRLREGEEMNHYPVTHFCLGQPSKTV